MPALVQRYDIDRIAVLVLTNPPVNGYSHAMHRELDAHVVDVRMDENIDCIVIRGEGEKFFCAGADIGYLRSLTSEQKYSFCLHANETLLRLENTPKLVIAALNGHCVGGGLEIALACDLRIGRSGGTKPDLVGLPEVTLGVLPGTGGTQRLTRILGRAKALEFMIEGRKVTVDEAVGLGLVHATLPAEGWWPALLDYARRFCRPNASSTAIGLIKRAVLGGADLPLESGLALERELQQRLFAGPDAREGLLAYAEKRAPVFAPPTSSPSTSPMPSPSQSPSPARSSPPAPTPSPAPSPRPTPPPETVPAETTAPHPKAKLRAAAIEPEGPQLPARPGPVARIAPNPRDELASFGDEHTNPGTRRPGAAGPTEEGFFEGAFDPDGPRPTSGPGKVGNQLGNVKDAVLNLVPRALVERWLLVPLRRDGDVLTVAMVDPSKVAGIREVEEDTGLTVKALKCPDFEISAAIIRYYRA